MIRVQRQVPVGWHRKPRGAALRRMPWEFCSSPCESSYTGFRSTLIRASHCSSLPLGPLVSPPSLCADWPIKRAETAIPFSSLSLTVLKDKSFSSHSRASSTCPKLCKLQSNRGVVSCALDRERRPAGAIMVFQMPGFPRDTRHGGAIMALVGKGR